MGLLIKYLTEVGSVQEIERNYYLEIMAKDSREIKEVAWQALSLQAHAAQANLETLRNIEEGQKQVSLNTAEIAQSISRVVDQFERFNTSIDTLTDISLMVNDSLNRITEQLQLQQVILQEIEETLKKPYETKVLELRRQAEKWLRAGMSTNGRERNDYWEDSLRLIAETLNNPIGAQDYVTWFQKGWLEWKHKHNLNQALDSFYQAQRYAAPEKNLYYIKSLRHFAYMNYLLSNYSDAYSIIEKAVSAINSTDKYSYYSPVRHRILYDAARYAWITNHKDIAINYLSKCIDLDPITIIEMYAEEDFK